MTLILLGLGFAGLWCACTLLALGLEGWLGQTRKIWSLPAKAGQLRSEIWTSLRFLVLCTGLSWGALQVGWLEFGASGALAFGSTWLATWVFFEVYYYGLHRTLHGRAFYRFHKHHHESRVTTAFTGFSLGVVESVVWIGGLLLPPILLAQAVGPPSFAGWAFYVVCNFYVNIAGHMNAEMMPAAAGSRGASWVSHPLVYHALHHARVRNHYAFASSFMDRLFGTEWDDWQSLHQRVIDGEPLDKLSVRG